MRYAERSLAGLNFLVGAAVGVAGGLIGLGGAELRLPYLVGVLGLSPRQAVPLNLAISLVTLLAALPARAIALTGMAAAPFALDALSLAAGAVIAAAVAAGWLHRMPGRWLASAILILLVGLGAGLIGEAFADGTAATTAVAGAEMMPRLLVAFVIGLGVGIVSSLLGVAGGEVIIPSLVFVFGAPIKIAGSLSLLISLPTVAMGLLRHAQRDGLLGRARLMAIVAPMAAGSVIGAVGGGLLVGLVSGEALKLALGCILIWSAWKVFRHERRPPSEIPADGPRQPTRA